jgi:23S rRNA (cytidine1920-2'-O)/16S rRNA (cytidine1409-2'-O)-methyltransferase
MDVSFISILKILPALYEIFAPGSPASSPILLSLIKPQFEAVRERVGLRGIVRDPKVHEEVLTRIARDARAAGFRMSGLVRLATRGQKGNQEFFARFDPGLPSEGGTAGRMEPLPRDVLEWIAAALTDGAEQTNGGLLG